MTKYDLPEEAAVQFEAAFANRNFDELRDLVYMHLGNLDLNYTNVPDIFPSKRLNFPLARKWLDEQMLNKPLSGYLPAKKPAGKAFEMPKINFDKVLAWLALVAAIICLAMLLFPGWFLGTLVLAVLAGSMIRSWLKIKPKNHEEFRKLWITENKAEVAAVLGIILTLLLQLHPVTFIILAIIMGLEAYRSL